MTEHIAYEPPERMFADTLLAFKDFEMASTWRVRVSADPLGPVNRIVSLMRGGQRIKSVLCPVPAGTSVRLVRDEGAWNIQELFALRDANWRTGEAPTIDIRPPGWRIEVDGKTVLTVTDAEMRPPRPLAPTIPLWTRMRRVFREQVRADFDWAAGKLGFHRADECGGWDE